MYIISIIIRIIAITAMMISMVIILGKQRICTHMLPLKSHDDAHVGPVIDS